MDIQLDGLNNLSGEIASEGKMSGKIVAIPRIDPTLTKSGHVADAKMVGDKFTEAEANISKLNDEIAEKFSDLNSVAFSGSYSDLSDKPTIPTKVSELTNDEGYKKTDNNVVMQLTAANAKFPLLLAPMGQSGTTNNITFFNSGVTLNPYAKMISANIDGDARFADEADFANELYPCYHIDGRTIGTFSSGETIRSCDTSVFIDVTSFFKDLRDVLNDMSAVDADVYYYNSSSDSILDQYYDDNFLPDGGIGDWLDGTSQCIAHVHARTHYPDISASGSDFIDRWWELTCYYLSSHNICMYKGIYIESANFSLNSDNNLMWKQVTLV